MLLGEVSEEEANQLLDNLMTEEEKQEEQEDDMDSLQGSEPVRWSRVEKERKGENQKPWEKGMGRKKTIQRIAKKWKEK